MATDHVSSETTATGRRPAVGWNDPLVLTTLAIVAVGTVVRIAYAATFDLATDEAYYWTWSHETVGSFLDHPPMVAWFVRIGTMLFGETPFGVRFMGLPALLATELLLADIVRRATGDRLAVLFTVLAMESALAYGLFAVQVKPDIPLMAFLAALVWSLVRLETSRAPAWWLAAGVFGGLALMSKFTAVLIAPAILVFMLVPKANRPWLVTIWPWAALALAVAIFSPVIAWNAGHAWAGFLFQSQRVTAMQFSFETVGNFLGTSFALVGLLVFPIAVFGAVATFLHAVRGRDGIGLLLASAFLIPFAYILQRSFFIEIIPTWLYPYWPFGIAAAAINAARLWAPGQDAKGARAARRWALAALVAGYAVTGASAYHAIADRSVWFGRLDPLGQEAGYGALTEDVLAAAEAGGAQWIATSSYRTYGELRWHLKGRMPVVQINERARYDGLTQPALTGPGLLLLGADGARPRLAGLPERPAEAPPPMRVERPWRGMVFEAFTVEIIRDWLPDLTPPHDSPLYRSQPPCC